MDRDEAALLLVLLVGGALLWLGGVLTPSSPTTDERIAWRRLWLPALPASVVFFVLLGFALADPEGPQSVGLTRLVASVPFAVVWVRAAVRGMTVACVEARGPAITKGFFRPRVELTPELSSSLDEGELRAVVAHEEAHVRHRDPLRIWLAQVVTDLQWPLTSARRRQRTWLRALELARDEEAVRAPKVSATDLASALVKAAGLTRPRSVGGAALTNDEAFLEARVRRLLVLSDAVPPRPRRRSSCAPLTLGVAVVAFLFGVSASAPVVAVLAGSP